jgi:hypothetical protein
VRQLGLAGDSNILVDLMEANLFSLAARRIEGATGRGTRGAGGILYRRKLHTSGAEEPVGADEEGVGPIPHEGGEGRFEQKSA